MDVRNTVHMGELCHVFGPSAGCYDGCVYFLCVNTGDTKWTFQTGDAVKCCPTVDPLTGLVLVGSHDGHMYSLDPQVCVCVHE